MCKSHANQILPAAIHTLPAATLAALKSLIPASAFQCSQVGVPTHKLHTSFASYGPAALESIVREVYMISPSEDVTMKNFADACIKVIPGFAPAPLYLSAAAQDFVRITNWLRSYVKTAIGSPIEAVPIYEKYGFQAWGTWGGNHVLSEIFPRVNLPTAWELDIIAGYALAAVAPPEITEIVLVFPLQGFAHTLHVGTWLHRDRFLDILVGVCEEEEMQDDETELITQIMSELMSKPLASDSLEPLPRSGHELMQYYRIGRHLPKEGPFAQSLRVVPDGSRAWQYFLSSPRMTKVSVKAEDVTASRAYISRTGARIFIHSPYIINLCQAPGPDNYGVRCLRETLVAASAAGCLGVVVHVGKTVKMDVIEALANMRENILACLDVATADCPLLLETPAGQGTETLLTYAEFFGFIAGIADPRLRVCVDTCHVFASGQCPLEYLQRAIREYPGWVRLIHFNDSLGVRGSCVDRHAPPGEGHIGLRLMTEIAKAGSAAGIGMLYE
jgi:deoxyribonuclease IV